MNIIILKQYPALYNIKKSVFKSGRTHADSVWSDTTPLPVTSLPSSNVWVLLCSRLKGNDSSVIIGYVTWISGWRV